MAQAKKKTSTKTAKRTTRAKAGGAKGRACARKSGGISNRERYHVYAVTALGMVAAILLCANAAMMIV